MKTVIVSVLVVMLSGIAGAEIKKFDITLKETKTLYGMDTDHPRILTLSNGVRYQLIKTTTLEANKKYKLDFQRVEEARCHPGQCCAIDQQDDDSYVSARVPVCVEIPSAHHFW